MKYKNKTIQISCDGGAATGKSTGAKMIAKKYNLKFLSSGLLYRYATFMIIKYQPKNKVKFLSAKFKNVSLSIKTYEALKRMSKKLLPGNTPLSISKTVETLVMERISKTDDSSKQSLTNEEALEIVGGNLDLWGVSGDDPRCGPKLELKKDNAND